jgi:hypothetical protein
MPFVREASPVSTTPHPAGLAAERLLADCEVERLRRSGPGGQHRNKVETAVRIRHCPTDITAEASERRSQPENLAVALRRLRVTLAVSVRSTGRFEPSEEWRRRVQNGRIVVSPRHAEFPVLLAEALDALAAHGWDVGETASRWACTASQLVKFLSLEPRALKLLNDHRGQQGRRRLRARTS